MQDTAATHSGGSQGPVPWNAKESTPGLGSTGSLHPEKGVTSLKERVVPQANKSRWDGIGRNKHGVRSPSWILCSRPLGVPLARLDFGPRPAIFEKPREKNYKHLKALYLKGYINGHPVNKILVDTDAVVNIMPYSVLCQLGHSAEDLIKTNVTLSDFNGQALEAQGVLNVDLTVGSKTVPTSFFIVSSKSTYTVLLRRDWIHANCCIPSMMRQCLIQWDGDEVEVVHTDDSIKISLTAMSVWDVEDQEPISGISLEGCDHVEPTKNGVRLVLSTGLTE
jgi:hypothetical protein